MRSQFILNANFERKISLTRKLFFIVFSSNWTEYSYFEVKRIIKSIKVVNQQFLILFIRPRSTEFEKKTEYSSYIQKKNVREKVEDTCSFIWLRVSPYDRNSPWTLECYFVVHRSENKTTQVPT